MFSDISNIQLGFQRVVNSKDEFIKDGFYNGLPTGMIGAGLVAGINYLGHSVSVISPLSAGLFCFAEFMAQKVCSKMALKTNFGPLKERLLTNAIYFSPAIIALGLGFGPMQVLSMIGLSILASRAQQLM